MILLEENRIITLGSGGRYLLTTDLGGLEGYGDNKYFQAVGVTPDDDLDLEDIPFVKTYQEDGQYYIERVEENTEEYDLLNVANAVKNLVDMYPNLKETLIKALDEFKG